MLNAFLNGFILSFSLILAIGAQNSFVLKQGLMRHHVFMVAFFCSVSDTLLIIAGVAGMSIFLNDHFNSISNWLFAISAIWLTGYGILKLKSSISGGSYLEASSNENNGIASTLFILVFLTFANPHVYLDTVILVGSVSQQFSGNDRIAYTIGASLASFVFFFALAYGAKLLVPIMQNPFAWRILDFLIALIMFTLALNLAYVGNWI